MGNQYAIAINQMALEGKLPAGDNRWSKFNSAFENQELEPLDFANAIYTGHAYTSWHNPMYRQSDNWACSQFIAVDMDTGDKRSSIKHLADHDFVMTYGGMIHTTPSHTPLNPRARVVFFLDRPIEHPTAYTNACKFLSELLGGDKVATDPSRFFYGNADCELSMINNCLSVDRLYTLYKRARHSKEKQAPQRHNETSKRHSGYHNRNEDKLQTIRQALEHLPPWSMDYDEWVSVIAAIKYELGDEGLWLAEQWGNGQKGEIQRMFRSFRRESGKVARIPTIIALAKRHGTYPG